MLALAVTVKTSLDHLPADKRAVLARVVDVIRAEAPAAAMIVLFGSHARGDWVSDDETGYRSDYDLLVVVDGQAVVEQHDLWLRVERAVDAITGAHHAQIIVHDFRDVNDQVRRAQFFFVELWQQGIVLFDSRHFQIARPKATTAEEHRTIAQDYFDRYFETAERRVVLCSDAAARGWTSEAAFELHHAAERYFAAALLVFTGTKPLLHKLDVLSAMVAPLHPLLAEPFPMASDEDKRLFDLLRRAYIESRYSKSYRITAEELGVLAERVKDLAGRIEQACKERIAAIG